MWRVCFSGLLALILTARAFGQSTSQQPYWGTDPNRVVFTIPVTDLINITSHQNAHGVRGAKAFWKSFGAATISMVVQRISGNNPNNDRILLLATLTNSWMHGSMINMLSGDPRLMEEPFTARVEFPVGPFRVEFRKGHGTTFFLPMEELVAILGSQLYYHHVYRLSGYDWKRSFLAGANVFRMTGSIHDAQGNRGAGGTIGGSTVIIYDPYDKRLSSSAILAHEWQHLRQADFFQRLIFPWTDGLSSGKDVRLPYEFYDLGKSEDNAGEVRFTFRWQVSRALAYVTFSAILATKSGAHVIEDPAYALTNDCLTKDVKPVPCR